MHILSDTGGGTAMRYRDPNERIRWEIQMEGKGRNNSDMIMVQGSNMVPSMVDAKLGEQIERINCDLEPRSTPQTVAERPRSYQLM